MGVFEPKEFKKLDQITKEVKLEVERFMTGIARKKEQLQGIYESIEEFNEMNQGMNEHQQELYRLITRQLLEAKVHHVDDYIKILNDETEAFVKAGAKKPA